LEKHKGRKEMPTTNKKEVPASALTNAIAIFLPIVRALIIEAEASGRNGPEKHAAVAEAAEKAYGVLQGSVKELRIVPWVLISPLVVPATGSLITVVVGVLNKLWGKVWSFVTKYLGDDE
tara:strand:+ start:1476 stop:1835 length:360 start_codon:yes stop_codon:yes gene_type:complete